MPGDNSDLIKADILDLELLFIKSLINNSFL